MIRKLRIKVIIVSMSIMTLMLLLLFGSIYVFTKRKLEEESLRMMSMIDSSFGMPLPLPDPRAPGGFPQDAPESIRLPFFSVMLDPQKNILSVFGGYYDLSDKDALQQITDRVIASGKDSGVLRDYHLRFLRMKTDGFDKIVFADISSEQATLSGLLKTCILLGILTFLIFYIPISRICFN